MAGSAPPRVVRDRLTRLAYAMIGVWAFFLYFLGPVTPVIAEQLGLSDAAAGVTSLMLAGGLVVCGFASPTIVARLGRRGAGLLAGALMATGVTVLVVSVGYVVVLAGVAVCSFAGALLMNAATASLSERQGSAAPAAFTEANAIAAWIGVLAPLLIGAAVAAGLGWRYAAAAVGLAALCLIGAILRLWRPEPAADSARDSEREQGESAGRSLPSGFFWSLAAIIAAVGAEISINFWGAVLLTQRTGVELATTTAALAVLLLGMAICRTVGPPLTRRIAVPKLVLTGMAVAAGGFFVVWVAGQLWVGIVGLFVTGLGLALLYPLTVSLALGHAAGDEDRAAAVIAVVMGCTMGAAPFALGALSGAVGVTWAFLIVPGLLAIGAVSVTRAAAVPAQAPTRRQ